MSIQEEKGKTLWSEIKKGNKIALSTLYNDHFQTLYEYGYRIYHDKELVEDCIQELFIRLWSKRESIQIRGSIKSYLLVSIRNAIFNEVKKSEKFFPISQEEVQLNFKVDYTVDSEFFKDHLQDDQITKLLEGFNKLTGRQKEMLYLKFFEGMSQEEVADIMGITVKASYKLSARALANLKDLMGISAPLLLSILEYWKRV
ncbi:sigma-70 family RNA polymerase sigma factor [Belliella sp. DSM 111904]|uniref:Sigma-70 family RNA polymerase sigma factor n=1 Tax=Belliella filtrata TaxID=2923435 RepID=A0ABS9UXS5_9BACT|nr:sigma-70 family RNA polymerase sigma factor [Belliella filtrata]MCH7408919.1 sigma-70 family RNA polymerase sigma factor [Belliella filtrata]